MSQLSDALLAAAHEAEELEKQQKDQDARLNICEARTCELNDRYDKLKGSLKKVKEALLASVIALEELEN